MSLASLIGEQWDIIVAAPLTFTLFGLTIISVTYKLTRIAIGGSLDACRERLQAANELIARSNGDNEELIKRLRAHGEDIQNIKLALDQKATIHVSADSPRPGDWKDGDIWFQHDK